MMTFENYEPVRDRKAEKAARKANRPWFKKKRFILPAIAAVLLVFGVAAGGGAETEPTSAAPTPTVVETEEATVSAEEQASADAAKEAEDAKKAEEEAAAKAAQEEADKAAAEKAAADAAAEEAAKGTVAQQNAKESAESYLDFTAFSYTGLIDQLEFEGYSTEDATWAVDRVEVDWNEQAAKSAASYLDFTSFSRQGLIDQLEFGGFTPEQAAYGADQAGL
jgi:colicin import membrane protein